MKIMQTYVSMAVVMLLSSAALASGGRGASNVRDFGAVGDGVADDTAAVQRAIDAGGVVHFPPGVYLVSPIYLRSDGGLDLDDAATLRMHPDRSRWDVRPECGKYKSNTAHLVNCVSATNVSIRGGTIDGDWRSFYKRVYFYQCGGRRFLTPRIRKGDPAQMVWFFESANVAIENVRFVRSPFWALWLHGCEDVRIDGVVVEGADEILNTDGFDIDCCRHVRVSRCRIRTGDDAIAVRGAYGGLTAPKACEDVVVEDCELASGYAHAIRIGVGGGEIGNIRFANIRMDYTRGGICVHSKFCRDAGVTIHDVTFDGVEMDAVCGVNVRHDFFLVPKDEPFRGTMRDIRFRNVRGTSILPNSVVGNGVATLSNVSFENCDIVVNTPRGVPMEERREFSLSPEDSGTWLIRNAEVDASGLSEWR